MIVITSYSIHYTKLYDITAGRAEIGDIVQLKITDSSEYDLIGAIDGALDE